MGDEAWCSFLPFQEGAENKQLDVKDSGMRLANKPGSSSGGGLAPGLGGRVDLRQHASREVGKGRITGKVVNPKAGKHLLSEAGVGAQRRQGVKEARAGPPTRNPPSVPAVGILRDRTVHVHSLFLLAFRSENQTRA